MLRQSVFNALHRFAHHPALNLLSGMILLFTGLIESIALVVEGMADVPIGAHHGIALFGFLQMIKALPDVMKGVKFVDEGERGLVLKPGHGGLHAAMPHEAGR